MKIVLRFLPWSVIEMIGPNRAGAYSAILTIWPINAELTKCG